MLEIFLKKYAWAANVVLLFAAAWLLAKTANTAVGAVIRPTPRIDAAGGPGFGPATPLTAPLEADRLFPLLGQKPPPPPELAGATPAAPPPPRTCSDLRAPPVRTSLRAQLVAGIVADPPRWSTAVITDTASRETRTFGIGEEVLGARLLSVERLRDDTDASRRAFRVAAIVCNGGQKEYVDFETGSGGGGPAPNVGVSPVPPPLAGAPAAGSAPTDGIKPIGDNRYEVQRSVIDGTLSNLNAVATQARIVPSFKNGVANGFKVFSIQPGSFYTAIGVENGDVIQKINGYEINSPDKALEVYQKLRESRHITMDIERNGQVIRKEYNVAGQ
jgi:general secretion pathway protein C